MRWARLWFYLTRRIFQLLGIFFRFHPFLCEPLLSKIHSCRPKHPKYVSFNNVMCCNLSRLLVHVGEKRGVEEKSRLIYGWLLKPTHRWSDRFFCYLLRHYTLRKLDDKNWMPFSHRHHVEFCLRAPPVRWEKKRARETWLALLLKRWIAIPFLSADLSP